MVYAGNGAQISEITFHINGANDMNKLVEFDRDRDDGYVYVTVRQMVEALQRMPEEAKVLLSVTVVGCCHNSEERAIPLMVREAEAKDYYLGDDLVVEISGL